MTTAVRQTQVAKRFISKCFLLPLVLRSSFFPPPGTRTLWCASPVQRSISSLPMDSADGIYEALPRGPVTGCCTSPGCTRKRLLARLLERHSQSHRSLLLLPASCWWDILWLPQDKVSPDSKSGKTATDHVLQSPHPQMLLRLAMIISLIDLPSATCQEAAGQSSSN